MYEKQEMYPVQFIEGFNESEEPATGRFLIWEQSGIAIPFTPAITYNLSRAEIYGAPNNLQVQREHHLNLLTDFKDRPSRNSIASGKLIVPEGNNEQWLQIVMEESIIVIAQRKYWFSLGEYPLSFSVGLALGGEELGLRTGTDQNWNPSSLGKHRCMIKFYGRIVSTVLPLSMKEEPYLAKSVRRMERCLMEIVKLTREQKELLVKRDWEEAKENHKPRKPTGDKIRQ